MTPIKHPRRLLLGPGPSPVPDEVLAALARPTLGHLDPVFLRIMDELRDNLRAIFATRNEMTLAMSGTGSAGMETLFANLVEPGDPVLICVAGVFGQRMTDVAARCGAVVKKLEVPWGKTFDQDRLIATIDGMFATGEFKPKLVAIVHAETSTGAAQPVDRLGAAIRRHGALFLLDCVTSLAGMPVSIDDWGVDAAYSGTQKCLSCPPGLSPVTLSPRALDKLAARRTKPQSWYLDLSMIRQYWGAERFYHHTAPTNMLVALHEATRLVLQEGLPARFARHAAAHDRLRAGLAAIGAGYLSDPDHTLPMLNAVTIPPGLDDAAHRRRLLDEFDIEVGGALGDFKGKAWRIGLMGHGARTENVDRLLAAIATLKG